MTRPSPWVICPTCSGDGHHAKHLGSFTATEFNDYFEDEDDRDAYFNGDYDRMCQTCRGSGKLREAELAAAMEEEDRRDRRQRMAETGRNEDGEPLW